MNLKSLDDGQFYFASESVTEGHPDKLCDAISDAVLDACLEQDPLSKVACETCAKSNTIMVFGEITTNAKINIEQIVRDKVKEIGYCNEKTGIDYRTCDVIIKITSQSNEIANSVHVDKDDLENLGAGDQGHMFGYATDETEELFPFSHLMALRLSEKLTEVRKSGLIPWLGPDGKTQITVQYKKDGNNIYPVRVHNVLVSAQHDSEVKNDEIREKLIENVIKPVIPKNFLDDNTTYFINPSGAFVVGGPEADAGLTGRKIIVDSYGGWGAHGGGCFSGKDPTKVDRSAAYAARWIAKSLVAAKLCKRVLVQISYSIGLSEPLSIHIDTFGTVVDGKTDIDLFYIVCKNFNLKPGYILQDLDLRKPIYSKTSAYGHFGRNLEGFTWEVPKTLEY